MKRAITIIILSTSVLLLGCRNDAACQGGEIVCDSPTDSTPVCAGYPPYWEVEIMWEFPAGGDHESTMPERVSFTRNEAWRSCQAGDGDPVCPDGEVAECVRYRALDATEMHESEGFCFSLSSSPSLIREGFRMHYRCRWEAPVRGTYDDGTPIDALDLGADFMGATHSYEMLPAAAP